MLVKRVNLAFIGRNSGVWSGRMRRDLRCHGNLSLLGQDWKDADPGHLYFLACFHLSVPPVIGKQEPKAQRRERRQAGPQACQFLSGFTWEMGGVANNAFSEKEERKLSQACPEVFAPLCILKIGRDKNGVRVFRQQRFSTFLMLKSFNAVPKVI